MSGNLESCDEISMKGFNIQYHKGQDQMQQGLKGNSPSTISGISSQVSILSERPLPSQPQVSQRDQLAGNFSSKNSQANSISYPQQPPLSIVSRSSMIGNTKNEGIREGYQINHLMKDFNIIKNAIDSPELGKYGNLDFQNNSKQVKQSQYNEFSEFAENQYQQYSQKSAVKNKQYPNSLGDSYEIKFPQSTQRLFEIDLSCSQLSNFPQDICSMLQLQKIKIDNNNITKLPEEIGNLTELKQLSLSENRLFSIPSSFVNLQNLILLNISKNYLDPFPMELCQLKNLLFFHIQNNYFISIPLEFSNLEKLQEFTIEWFKYTMPSMNQLQQDQGVLLKLRQECKRLLAIRNQSENQKSYPSINAQSDNTNYKFQNISYANLNSIRLEQKSKESSYSFKSSDGMLDEIEEISNGYFEKEGRNRVININTTQIKPASKQMNNINMRINNDLSFQDFLSLFSQDPIAYLSKSDNRGRNIFHISALNQEISIIKASTLCQLDPQSINKMDDDNQTPLSLSLLEDKFLSAKILLFFGADPLIGGGKLGTCLHIAVTKMDIEIVSQILSKGGDPNSRDFEGNTPLHLIFSIFRKNEQKAAAIVGLLIEKGVNCNLKNFDNWSALHLSVKRAQIEAIQWIAQNEKYRQKFNWDIQGGNQQLSLLHLASKLGFTDIVQVLIERVDPLIISKCNKIARDVGQNNNLISKLLKKRELQVISQHFSLVNKTLAENEYDENQDQEAQKFKHLKSTFLFENKSFPIEKYEQLIEEKLAAAKSINFKKKSQHIDPNIYSRKTSNSQYNPSTKGIDNFQWIMQKDTPIDNSYCHLDYLDSERESFKLQSQDNSTKNQKFQDPFVNELQQFCQYVNNQVMKSQFEFSNLYYFSKGDFLDKKYDNYLSDNNNKDNSKTYSDDGQINSSDILENCDAQYKQNYRVDSQRNKQNTNFQTMNKVFQSYQNKNVDHSFETIEDTDENIPEEHTYQANKKIFNLEHYQSNSHSLQQNNEFDIIYQNILKQSINILIDNRVNLTWKLQLLQIFQQQLQTRELKEAQTNQIQPMSQRQNQSGRITEFSEDNRNKYYDGNSPISTLAQSSITNSNIGSQFSNMINMQNEERIKHKALIEYLPLYLQSVLRYNAERGNNILVSQQICELIVPIQNEKIYSFLKEFGKELVSQQSQCNSNQLFLAKNVIDYFQYTVIQQQLKKKISPLQNKVHSKSKHQTQSQPLKTQQQVTQSIALTPAISSTVVRIPRVDLSKLNQDQEQPQLKKQQSGSIKKQGSKSPLGHTYEQAQKKINEKQMFHLSYKYQTPLFNNSYIKQNDSTNNDISKQLKQDEIAWYQKQNELYNKENSKQYNQEDSNQVENKNIAIINVNLQNLEGHQNFEGYEANNQSSRISQPNNHALSSPNIMKSFSKDMLYNQNYYDVKDNYTKLITFGNIVHKTNQPQNISQINKTNNASINMTNITSNNPTNNLSMNSSNNFAFQQLNNSNMNSKFNKNTHSNNNKSLTPEKRHMILNPSSDIKDSSKSNSATPRSMFHNDQTIQDQSILPFAPYSSGQYIKDIEQQSKAQQNYLKNVLNNTTNNQSINKDIQQIQLNSCHTPVQSNKTSSASTERFRSSANSFNIQQKMLLNRIIPQKTVTQKEQTIVQKKPERLFESNLEKIQKQQQQQQQQQQSQQSQIQQNTDLTKYSAKYLQISIKKNPDDLNSSSQQSKLIVPDQNQSVLDKKKNSIGSPSSFLNKSNNFSTKSSQLEKQNTSSNSFAQLSSIQNVLNTQKDNSQKASSSQSPIQQTTQQSTNQQQQKKQNKTIK